MAKRSSGMSRLLGSLDEGLDPRLAEGVLEDDQYDLGGEESEDDEDAYGEKRKREENGLTLAMILAYDGNIADLMDEEGEYGLKKLGERVVAEYELDEASRREWREGAEEALRIAGMQRGKKKDFPYPNASNVSLPVLTTSAIQFQARAYPSIVRGDEVVEAKIKGQDRDNQKQARCERIGAFLNDQLIYQCDEWETGTDALLLSLPIVGKAFRKVYWDGALNRPRLDFCNALDVVVPCDAPSMDLTPRITQIVKKYPYEYEQLVHQGVWKKAKVERDETDTQKLLTFLEQVRYCDMDQDGLAEPYIVTVYKETNEVVRVDPAYDIEDVTATQDEETGEIKILAVKRNDPWVEYTFLPDPNGSAYGIGFGQLLDHVTRVVNTMINQMIDAGTWANTMTGFVGAGVGMKTRGGAIQMEPNKFKFMDGVSDIKSALMRLEHPGPSPVQFQMVEFLLEQIKDITAVKDVLTGDAPGQQPATSTLALIEQAQQTFNAIFKRIYRSLKRELEKICRLNARYLSAEDYQKFLDEMPEPIAPSGPPPGGPQPDPMMGHNGGPPMGPMDMGGPIPQDMSAGVMPQQGGAGDPSSQGPPPAPPMGAVVPFPGPSGGGVGGSAAMPGQAPPPLPMAPPPPTPDRDFDLSDMDVQPLADPAAITEMQRLAKANFVAQFVLNDPTANRVEALRYICKSARLPDLDKLVPEKNPGLEKQAQLADQNAQADLRLKAADAGLKEAQAQKTGADVQTAQQDSALKGHEANLKAQEMQHKAEELRQKGLTEEFDRDIRAQETMLKGRQVDQGDRKLDQDDVRLEIEAADKEMTAAREAETAQNQMGMEAEKMDLERERFAAEDEDRRTGREIEQAQLGADIEDKEANRGLERERMAQEKGEADEGRKVEREKMANDKGAGDEDRKLERERMSQEKGEAGEGRKLEREKMAQDRETKDKDRKVASDKNQMAADDAKTKAAQKAADEAQDAAKKAKEAADAVGKEISEAIAAMREANQATTRRIKFKRDSAGKLSEAEESYE